MIKLLGAASALVLLVAMGAADAQQQTQPGQAAQGQEQQEGQCPPGHTCPPGASATQGQQATGGGAQGDVSGQQGGAAAPPGIQSGETALSPRPEAQPSQTQEGQSQPQQ